MYSGILALVYELGATSLRDTEKCYDCNKTSSGGMACMI